jgi:drug/metabolite transporter (DMT)-like permease
MDQMAVILALSAAFAWGCSDFIGGVASRRFGALTVLLLIEAGGLAVMTAICLAIKPPLPETTDVLQLLGAGLLGVAGLGLFYHAMAIGTMSVVAPIAGSGVVLPVAAGVLAGDRPSAVQWAGLAAVVVGVMLASREQSEVHADATAARRSILFALVAAACFGSFFVLLEGPAEESVAWTVLLIRVAPMPVLIALWLRGGASLPPGPVTAGLLVAGTIDLAATSLIALATREGDLSIVSVLSSMYPVITVLLAAALLHERLLRSQYVGVVLALGGVVAVAGG